VSATEAITRPSTGGAALSEDLHGLRDLVREFVRRELLPLEQIVQEREAARGLGNDPVIPPEDHARLTRRARELDLWGLDIPPELGGQGLGVLAKMVATEEINRSIVPFRLPPESTSISFLIEGCTPEQRERFVLPYTRDGKRMALALSEPNAGADAAAIETTAARADGGWLLNGAKTFISWADEADLVIVMALTDREKRSRGGITAFLVEAGTPGMHVGRHIPTMGHHTPNEMSFTDCFVPDGQVLGEVGYGFTPLAQCLNVIRVDVGARALGMAERLIDMMVEHANTRVTFGQKLADRQAVQWMIADSVMEVHAARLMVHDAAAKLDAGVKDVRTEASSVKVFATEMISRVVDRAMQVYGGMGYTRDLPIEFIYRNSRIMRIMDGPSEIHRQQIARLRLRRAPVR
jgi:(R)-benzylsuccinyl-CoA dehydrogenase